MSLLTAKSSFCYVGSDVAAWYANRATTSLAKQPSPNKQAIEGATPKESDFMEFAFRLLSATTVGKEGWNCTEFTSDVLKKALSMFADKPAYANHQMYVGKAIGNIVNPVFENSYIDAKTGILVPAGINVDFRISAVRQPALVYDLQSTPSPIQSCSASLEYTWKPSHQFEDDFDFFWHLGEEITLSNGIKEVVRMIAVEIVDVTEGSLVWNGADPFAKRIRKDETGKSWLDHIQKSGIVSNAKVQEFAKKLEEMGKRYHVGNFFEDKKTATENKSMQTPEKEDNKNTVLEAKLAEFEKVTVDLQKANTELQAAKSLVAELQAKLTTQEADAKLAQDLRTEKVAYAKRVYTLSVGSNVNETMLQLIEKTSFKELDGLIESWGGKAMTFFGEPACKKCGHQEFQIRSSVTSDVPKNKQSKEDEPTDTFEDNFRH
jgi:predicted Zn-ribbon and HTH transcriptional regulator